MPSEVVLAALQALLKAIAPLRLPQALLGGLALAVWKHPRFTKDVDVLLALGETDKFRLLEVVATAGFRPKRGDGLLRLGELEILQLLYEPPGALIDVQVDMLLAGDPYQHAALARRIPAAIPDIDVPVYVLSCEDMIVHKLLAGRAIDFADAVALLRANRTLLDYGYLLHWIKEKRIETEFARVWEDSFPGERNPHVMT